MAAAYKHIALICNPLLLSKKAEKIISIITTKLFQNDVAYTLFHKQWPVQLEDFSEVWIIGGDGTLNYFVNQYRGIQLPLSIFGCGTGNDFHWMLYGKITVEEQVEQVLKGGQQKIDAGVCNGKFFLNGVGIGFDGAVVKDLLGKKKMPGKASYLVTIFKNILGYKEKHCTINLAGQVLQQDCFMISIANGKRFGGGFYVAPNALINDGLLDVNIVSKIAPLNRIRYLPVIEKGKHLALPFILHKQCTGCSINFVQPVHAHADGEYFFAETFDVMVLPEHFSFLV